MKRRFGPFAKNPPISSCSTSSLDGYDVAAHAGSRGVAEDPGDVPELARRSDRQGPRVRSGRQRLRHQAVRAPGNSGPRAFAPAGEGVFRHGAEAPHARDLRIARKIQMGLLQTNLRPLTEDTGLDVAAVIEPARFVGGDPLRRNSRGDRVVVAFGDVSGKGIPAALFMAVTLTLLRTMALLHEDPAENPQPLNDELAQQNPRGMFVTVQCAVFDVRLGRVTVAGAGHHSAVVLSPGSPPRLAFPSTGRVAGIIPQTK